MRRLRSTSALLLLLALPGCLVSFNDYPLGDPEGAPSDGGSAGSLSVVPEGGSGATNGAAASSAGGSGAASSGAAMVGGDAGAPDLVQPGSSNLIDDFEDGDAAIPELDGRNGAWYASNDGRGMQTPMNGAEVLPVALSVARAGSAHGVHTFGGPFATWGALIGTVLASGGANGAPYDVSGYRGLRFWVRSGATVAFAARQVRLSVRTPLTVMGEGCTVCGDHFGADIPLTAQWQRIEVPFSSLKQRGFGRPVLTGPDLTQVLGIEFLFTVNVSFDLWLDDIELY